SGIQTIEAADNGLKSITKTVESMQSTLRQARQDKSFKTESYTLDADRTAVAGDNLEFSGGAVGDTAVAVSLNKSTSSTATAVADVTAANDGDDFTIAVGTVETAEISLADGDTAQDIVDKINAATAAADLAVTASVNEDGGITLTSADGADITVADGTDTG